MDAASVAPALKRKPNRIWLLITFITGAVGALGSVAALGTGTYDVEPFTIELRAQIAPAGKTELAVRPSPAAVALPPSHAEAGTHNSPIVFRATVVGLSGQLLTSDPKKVATPQAFKGFLGDEGKEAVRSFAIKLAALALAGGAAAGAGLSLIGMRFRRVVGAALSGLLVFGVIGALVQQTYDPDAFVKTRFVLDGGGPVGTPSDLPGTITVPSL